MSRAASPLSNFHPAVAEWFHASFPSATPVQTQGWPPIQDGRSSLLLAPTGSGKTLAAFLAAIDKLMFSDEPPKDRRCRVIYVSPLKALAIDVERNLRAPIAGIAAAAARRGDVHRIPQVVIRTGDTPAAERARMRRAPPDILITTPESLFLILTSQAQAMVAAVETVIVDEIHAVVATKRGSHLSLSLERLEQAAERETPLQRIGLSATQRPLEEVARFLGGGTVRGKRGRWTPRPVEIVDAGRKRSVEVTIEVPVDDMGSLGDLVDVPSGPAAAGPKARSIWPSIHPRVLELIRAHRSTMVFVNSRRLAERLAGALNELAGEELVLAHHGSISRERRTEIEDRLKRGDLRGIVATSTLELGIDMGAVDLVIQAEAPPSSASGLQRIGRASHHVTGTPKGIIFPKFRGDLLASAAVARRITRGEVEETIYPRHPLDVLAQQVVAAACVRSWPTEELFDLVRQAAPFAELPRSSFDGVLDMLSGRYPSDEFAELRPRIVWDRVKGTIRARDGAQRVVLANAGTIPDRGLYPVFLSGDDTGKSRRVGELDEEMVFESRAGDVFLLGASSWRIEEIHHDRVLVSPAPGEPGRMPFWIADRPGRPAETGRAIGALTRELAGLSEREGIDRLERDHGCDARAAQNLARYVLEQKEATGEVPSDRAIVVERWRDEMGDWRVCVMTPFGARIHAPWVTAVRTRFEAQEGVTIDVIWSDDGMVFRVPELDAPPDVAALFPAPDEVEDLVMRHLGETALFAARFRENAARALLLPRRHPGRRAALWHQRRRAADLLAVASRFGSFPILLESYRECLRDVFDLPGLTDLMRRVQQRSIRVVPVDVTRPSPFASSLLFTYVGNFVYDRDAPLAERRAQLLTIDQAQLRELLGEEELRELFDATVIDELTAELQRMGSRGARSGDGVCDLLLAIGDLTMDELRQRTLEPESIAAWVEALVAERRAIPVTIAGERRLIAAEDAARYRDVLGCAIPQGLPQAFLVAPTDPVGDLVSRFARTHGPFAIETCAARLGLGVAPVRAALERLRDADRMLEGEFLPNGRSREWCDVGVLRTIKRRSLARLRKEVEPVEPVALARFLHAWHGLDHVRRGADALIEVIEQLQGAALPFSTLERDVFPARIEAYRPADLDLLCATGAVVWRGIEPLAPSDGRIALFAADAAPLLMPPPGEAEGPLARKIVTALSDGGALFFQDLLARVGGFGGDVVRALWDLVWAGLVTNDTLAPLRTVLGGTVSRHSPEQRIRARFLRGRRTGPPGSEGRWSLLVAGRTEKPPSETERRTALARQLLVRHGVLTREAVQTEAVAGGFSSVYGVLKAMEDAGQIRRGRFIAGLGATQFALPGADDRLRQASSDPDRTWVIAASDPANPYGAVVPWPEHGESRPERRAGAHVVLRDGALVAWIGRHATDLITFLPKFEPETSRAARALAVALATFAGSRFGRGTSLATIDGGSAATSVLAPHLRAAGFQATSSGWVLRAQPRASESADA